MKYFTLTSYVITNPIYLKLSEKNTCDDTIFNKVRKDYGIFHGKGWLMTQLSHGLA